MLEAAADEAGATRRIRHRRPCAQQPRANRTVPSRSRRRARHPRPHATARREGGLRLAWPVPATGKVWRAWRSGTATSTGPSNCSRKVTDADRPPCGGTRRGTRCTKPAWPWSSATSTRRRGSSRTCGPASARSRRPGTGWRCTSPAGAAISTKRAGCCPIWWTWSRSGGADGQLLHDVVVGIARGGRGRGRGAAAGLADDRRRRPTGRGQRARGNRCSQVSSSRLPDSTRRRSSRTRRPTHEARTFSATRRAGTSHVGTARSLIALNRLGEARDHAERARSCSTTGAGGASTTSKRSSADSASGLTSPDPNRSPPRARGRRTPRRGTEQRRAGGPAVHLAEDRRRPCVEHPRQARDELARRDRGIRRPRRRPASV